MTFILNLEDWNSSPRGVTFYYDMALVIFLDQYQIFTRNRLKMYFYDRDGMARPVRTWVIEGPVSPPEISFTRGLKLYDRPMIKDIK